MSALLQWKLESICFLFGLVCYFSVFCLFACFLLVVLNPMSLYKFVYFPCSHLTRLTCSFLRTKLSGLFLLYLSGVSIKGMY